MIPDAGHNHVTWVADWDYATSAPAYTPIANGTWLEGPSFGTSLTIRGSGGFSSIAGSGEVRSFRFHADAYQSFCYIKII